MNTTSKVFETPEASGVNDLESSTQQMRHIPIQGLTNLRDLGGYPTAGGGQTRWHRVYRSDSPHRLDSEGQQELLSRGITTIIDLRRDDELRVSTNPFAQFEDVDYHHISVFPLLDPAEYIHDPRILPELYRRALRERSALFGQVLRLIANTEKSVLFHCTIGKDRTGIIAAILLQIAGVPRCEILRDYTLTAELIEPLMHTLIQSAIDRNIPLDSYREIMKCAPETMAETLDALDSHPGGLSGWLADAGVGEAEVGAIKDKLVG